MFYFHSMLYVYDNNKKFILIKLLSYLLQLLWPYLFINYQGKIRKIRNLKVSCKSHIRVEEEEKVNYSSILISHESFLSVSHDLSFSSYSSVSPDNVDLTFIATFLRRFNLRCCERTQLNTLFSKTWPILKCITSFSIFFSFFTMTRYDDFCKALNTLRALFTMLNEGFTFCFTSKINCSAEEKEKIFEEWATKENIYLSFNSSWPTFYFLGITTIYKAGFKSLTDLLWTIIWVT